MRRPLEDWGRELEEWVEDELTELEREWEFGRKSRGILFDIWRAIILDWETRRVEEKIWWAGHGK
jgi:hypothetical protein